MTGADPFAGMDDGQVIAAAAAHFRKAAGYPKGSTRRSQELAAFRRAYAEFSRREDMRVVRYLGASLAGHLAH